MELNQVTDLQFTELHKFDTRPPSLLDIVPINLVHDDYDLKVRRFCQSLQQVLHFHIGVADHNTDLRCNMMRGSKMISSQGNKADRCHRSQSGAAAQDSQATALNLISFQTIFNTTVGKPTRNYKLTTKPV